MNCPFEECQRTTTLPLESATHLIVAIDLDDRAHIHGPIQPENRQLIKRMLMEVAWYCEIDLQELAQDFKKANISKSSTPTMLQ